MIEFRIDRSFSFYPGQEYGIFIRDHAPQGNDKVLRVCQPLTFSEQPSHICADPAVRISESEAQQLMDELWLAGIRPSNGEGAVGQIGAIRHHLSDMRRLVAKMSKCDLPEVTP